MAADWWLCSRRFFVFWRILEEVVIHMIVAG